MNRILPVLLVIAGCAATPDAPVPPNPGPFDAAIRIPVGDVVLKGTLFVADNEQPKPTLVWLHGFPGLPEPSSAAIEAVRGAGLNVLHFHYRGAWGAPGGFSVAHARADARAALAHLRRPELARLYRIDTDALIPVGDSFGSWVALQTAAEDPAVPCSAGALVLDLGALGEQFRTDPGVRAGFQQMFSAIAEDPALEYRFAAGPESFTDEIAADHAKNALVGLASAFGERPVMLMGAAADELAPPQRHLEPLAAALRSATVKIYAGGHELADAAYAGDLARWVLANCR